MGLPDIDSRTVQYLFDALIHGLEDYSADERGDVGSWIRVACIQGLTTFSLNMFSQTTPPSLFLECFPSEKYQSAVAGILKQGVERLDKVRREAGQCFLKLLRQQLPPVPNASEWQIHEEILMHELFTRWGSSCLTSVMN